MKPRSTEFSAARQAAALLHQGLALALHDISAGRAELQEAAARFEALGDARGRLLASCALVVFIGIADDDYGGFETAAAVVTGTHGAAGAWPDPGDALLVEAGALTAGSFNALDAPELAARAAAIAQALGNATIAAPLRCCAGLAALGYHHIGMDLASVLWLELALRPLLADPALGTSSTPSGLRLVI